MSRRLCCCLLALASVQLWGCSSNLRGVDADEPAVDGAARKDASEAGAAMSSADRDPPVKSDAAVKSDAESESAGGRESDAGADADASSERAPSQPERDSEPRDPRQPRVELGKTEVVAPMVGRTATPAAGQSQIGVHGTDLGISFVHRGTLHFMFGDTWSDEDVTLIDPVNDDVQGSVSLADFPNGRAVDAYARAHPARAGMPSWAASGPPIEFPVNAQGRVAAIHVERDGAQLSMSLGRTPIAGFSSGTDVFGIFHRWIPVPCAGGATPTCDEGLTCDRGLGTVLGQQGDWASPCVIGELGCTAVPGGGLCQDRTSSLYTDDAWGRVQAVLLQDEFGNLDRTDPTRYLTRTWYTHRFRSPSVRTVSDFDPQRKDGAGNRYGPATGAGAAREKVFVWGRPAFGAPAARNAHAAVYFMYLDMPVYSATGDIELSKHYFTGLREGVPQFSNREPDAVALDLSSPGDDPTREPHDIVSQMSVVWIESIAQWVMIYGGDLPERVLPILVGKDSKVRPDPEGAVHVRFADQPWGPWSAPQQLYKATGDAGAAAPGGILRRPDCTAASCAPHEAGYPDTDIGVMYGASIVEPWTETHADGIDLYWNVSTWDPYQVVLLKSRFARR